MHYLAKSIVTDTSAADPFLSAFAVLCFLGIVGGLAYFTRLVVRAFDWIGAHLPNGRRATDSQLKADRARLLAQVEQTLSDGPQPRRRASESEPVDRSVAL